MRDRQLRSPGGGYSATAGTLTFLSGAAHTPLQEAPPQLGAGPRALLKREDLHELGAFKWRGALPTLTALRERGADTVVTFSTGNHGAATAWAARRLGMRAVVFLPAVASRTKVELLESLSATLRLEGVGDHRQARRKELAVDHARLVAEQDPLLVVVDESEQRQ